MLKEKINIYKVLFYVLLLILLIIILISTYYLKDYKSKNSQLSEENMILINNYSSVINQYSASPIPPYIQIYNRTVYLYFRELDGSIQSWYIPFDILQNEIQEGYRVRQLLPSIIPGSIQLYNAYANLCSYSGNNCGSLEQDKNLILNLENESIQYVTLTNNKGNNMSYVDYRQFVVTSPFSTVIPQLYQERSSDDKFIHEVWNIVTQLNTYSAIGQTPRYPLETFLAGGGDCDNTAVLFASMIKAAPTNWDVGLIYVDTNNLQNPVVSNHLMVEIKTDNATYLIDTTQNQNMEPYGNQLNGWYFKI